MDGGIYKEHSPNIRIEMWKMSISKECIPNHEQHEIMGDALAAVRFYYVCYGDSGEFPARLREIIGALRDIGERRNGQLLVQLADTLSKGYAGAASITPERKQSVD